MTCKTCKHWTEKTHECTGMLYSDKIDIDLPYIYEDRTMGKILTEPDFFCALYEEREKK